MDITEQGILVPSALDVEIYNKVNYLADIRFYFYKKPADTDAILSLMDKVDKETAKAVLQSSMYQHSVKNEDDVQITEDELIGVLDKSRRILLTKYRELQWTTLLKYY